MNRNISSLKVGDIVCRHYYNVMDFCSKIGKGVVCKSSKMYVTVKFGGGKLNKYHKPSGNGVRNQYSVLEYDWIDLWNDQYRERYKKYILFKNIKSLTNKLFNEWSKLNRLNKEDINSKNLRDIFRGLINLDDILSKVGGD